MLIRVWIAVALLVTGCGYRTREAGSPPAADSDRRRDACKGRGDCDDRTPDDSPPPAVCTPGSQSVPGMPGDPCPQNTPECPASSGGVAVTQCLATGSWSKPCRCSIRDPGVAPPPGGMAGSGAAGSGAPSVVCGRVTCPEPLAGSSFPRNLLPKACCLDAFTSTCGTQAPNATTCARVPSSHPDCPWRIPPPTGFPIATCCAAGVCGLTMGVECFQMPGFVDPIACDVGSETDAGT